MRSTEDLERGAGSVSRLVALARSSEVGVSMDGLLEEAAEDRGNRSAMIRRLTSPLRAICGDQQWSASRA
jgi:hypothetical protein